MNDKFWDKGMFNLQIFDYQLIANQSSLFYWL